MRNFKNFMKNEPAHHEPIKSNIWEEDPHTHISTTFLLEEIRQDLKKSQKFLMVIGLLTAVTLLLSIAAFALASVAYWKSTTYNTDPFRKCQSSTKPEWSNNQQ